MGRDRLISAPSILTNRSPNYCRTTELLQLGFNFLKYPANQRFRNSAASQLQLSQARLKNQGGYHEENASYVRNVALLVCFYTVDAGG